MKPRIPTFDRCAAAWMFAAVLVLFAGATRAEEAPAKAEPPAPWVHPLTKRKPAKPLPASMYKILEKEDREARERPEAVLDKMNLAPGMTVADIGAGSGYFTLRIAKRLAGSGKVLAVDIQQGMLDVLKEKAAAAGAKNIEYILSEEADPKLPMGAVDWVLLVDAYHEFSKPEEMLKGIRQALRRGTGRAAVVEYRGEPLLETLKIVPPDHRMTFEQAVAEWSAAGFELESLHGFLPSQHLFIFKVKEDAAMAGALKIEQLPAGAMRHLSTLEGRVYFAGQPSPEDLKTFAAKGVKTVINLRPETEQAGQGWSEPGAVREAGMNYVHAPVGHGAPSGDALGRVWSVLKDPAQGPVLLHCASSNRVGMIWAMFRGGIEGIPEEQAIEEGKAAGLTAPPLAETARKFIRESKAAGK